MEIGHLITVFIWLMFIFFGISSSRLEKNEKITNSSTRIEKNEELTKSSIITHDRTSEITCDELSDIAVVGAIFISTSSKEKNEVPVNFYLSTNKQRTQTKVGPENWAVLKNSGFDPSLKTFIIIHGYKSGGSKPWVLEMKDKLLDTTNGNIFMVDWSQGSNRKNYVTAARNTLLATSRIYNFLQTLRAEINIWGKATGETQWNHLYFIGHSLGAQISGQTAHLLKQDKFWKVERITGLDPAKPCFKEADRSLRIDIDDADFVDIIHTQVGTGGSADALGLPESIGHMDFYVNTGIMQPSCIGSFFNPRWNTMICSHKLAYRYFTESIVNSKTDTCRFEGYPWDGTYAAAEYIVSRARKGEHTGIYMGIDAPKNTPRGRFLVITGPNEPYCKDLPLHLGKSSYLKNLLKVIRRLKGLVSIFNPIRIHNPNPREVLIIPEW